MVRIFLENQELDINEGFTHQMTYAVDDLKNLDSKSTAYSKTIVLPGTTKNNDLLGNIFEIHNANFTVPGSTNIGYNFNATVSAKVRVEVNGIQIVKGILRLMEIIIDGSHIEYEVVIFGELGGFYSKLGGKKLEDIDFSDYTHTYNYTSISNSWLTPITFTGPMDFVGKKLIIYGIKDYSLNAGDLINITNAGTNNGTYTVVSYEYYGSKATITIFSNWASQANYLAGTITFEAKGYGYYYPLIDYGMVSIDKFDYDVTALRPAIFVKEVMHRMIVNAGYTWESNFFNSELFENLIIPNNQKNFEVLKTRIFTGLTQSFSFNGSATNVSLSNTANIINTTTSDNITYTYNGTNGYFNVNYGITFNTTKISGSSFNFFIGFKIALLRTRGITTSVQYISPTYNYYQYKSVIRPAGGYMANVDIAFLFSVSNMELQTSDQFFFVLYQDVATTLTGSSTQANTAITIDSGKPIMLPVAIGDSINLNSCIPQNILQKDLFTSIMKMFNLMVIEDKLVEKKLIIEPYVDFYQTAPSTYIDWTYKIDRNSPIRIKPMSEANARVYKMNYKEDTDFYNDNYKKKYNEGYSSFTYDNLLEFSKETSNLEIIFASTPLVNYGSNINVYKTVSTIFKKNNEAEDSTPSQIRILFRANLEMTYDYNLYTNIWNSGSTLYRSGITNFPYAGHLWLESTSADPSFDFSFGAPKEIYVQGLNTYPSDNLFNTYYSPYIAEITDKDSRLVTMKAKLTEIDIYNLDFRRLIFVDGVLYRLQKVIDYSAGELCTIELLRVINVIY